MRKIKNKKFAQQIFKHTTINIIIGMASAGLFLNEETKFEDFLLSASVCSVIGGISRNICVVVTRD